MINVVRWLCRGSCLVLVSGILIPAFYCPQNRPSDRALCRKELDLIALILSTEGEWKCERDDGLRGNVAKACLDANEKLHPSPFRFAMEGCGRVLIDRWGTPYNMCLSNESAWLKRSKLRYSNIGNMILWSSGPNRINELGKGDDVTIR